MKNELNEEYTFEEPEDVLAREIAQEERIFGILSSIGMSLGLVEVAFGLINVSVTLPTHLLVGALSTAVLAPIINFTFKKIKERDRIQDEKHWRCTRQTLMMLREEYTEKDRVIGKTTTNFTDKIETMKKDIDLSLDAATITYINDLLYLINSNYYQEITAYLPSLNREQLVDNILAQVGMYLSTTKNKKFGNKDINNILENCFFIRDDLKKEILTEYKESETKFNKWVEHSIINRTVDILDFDAYCEEKARELPQYPGFDINDITSYHDVIQGLCAADDYLRHYGDIDSLIWDVESLKEMMLIVATDHRQELIGEIKDYSNFELVTKFTYNAMCYAIMNKKINVTPHEMLATFKEWDYIPLESRINIATDIIEKMALDTEKNPFGIKSATKQKSKIYIFPKENSGNNNQN